MKKLLIGPPGTGKTTHIVQLVRHVLSVGYGPESIGVFSFTRAAAEELRLRLDDKRLTNVRTIHSLAMKLAGHRQPMETKHWWRFASEFKYRLSWEDSEDADDDEKKEDDDLRRAWINSRARMISIEEAAHDFDVMPAALHRFTQDLTVFKKLTSFCEFDDLLYEVLERKLCSSLRLLVVDEAQDVSPLQAAVIDQWANACPDSALVGDDYQAIYEFAGANGALMRRWREDGAVVKVLEQSYRLPQAVLALAENVGQKISDGIPRAFLPRDEQGAVDVAHLHELKRITDRGGLVLARTRKQVRSLSEVLDQDGVLYTCRMLGVSPLDLIPAAAAVLVLLEGKHVSRVALGLIEKAMRVRSDRRSNIGAVEMATLADLPPEKARALKARGVAALGKKGEALERLARKHDLVRDLLAGKGARDAAVPCDLELSTIHGAKGREHDSVIVLDDWATRPYRALMGVSRGARDSEHRTGYVAITRARSRLTILRSSARLTGRPPNPYGFL
jgi:superfamily I DNA/RNA helicase